MREIDRLLREQREAQSSIRVGWAVLGAAGALVAEKVLMLASGMGRTAFPWWCIVMCGIVGGVIALAGERGR